MYLQMMKNFAKLLYNNRLGVNIIFNHDYFFEKS